MPLESRDVELVVALSLRFACNLNQPHVAGVRSDHAQLNASARNFRVYVFACILCSPINLFTKRECPKKLGCLTYRRQQVT